MSKASSFGALHMLQGQNLSVLNPIPGSWPITAPVCSSHLSRCQQLVWRRPVFLPCAALPARRGGVWGLGRTTAVLLRRPALGRSPPGHGPGTRYSSTRRILPAGDTGTVGCRATRQKVRATASRPTLDGASAWLAYTAQKVM